MKWLERWKWLEKVWIFTLSVLMIGMVFHMIYEGQTVWYSIVLGIYGFFMILLLTQALIEEML